MAVMSAVGSPSSATRSARSPGLIVPVSAARPSDSAATEVQAANAAAAVSPDSSASSCGISAYWPNGGAEPV